MHLVTKGCNHRDNIQVNQKHSIKMKNFPCYDGGSFVESLHDLISAV